MWLVDLSAQFKHHEHANMQIAPHAYAFEEGLHTKQRKQRGGEMESVAYNMFCSVY